MDALELFERVVTAVMPALTVSLPVLGTVAVAYINSRLKKTVEGASEEAVQDTTKRPPIENSSSDMQTRLVHIQNSCIVLLHELDHVKAELAHIRSALISENQKV